MGDFAPEVKKILREHGCYFVRQGKGDHEMWKSLINGKSFPVDHKIKSRHCQWHIEASRLAEGVQLAASPQQRTFNPMTGHRRFNVLTKGFSPERKARVAARVSQLKANMPLNELRRAHERSQEDLADVPPSRAK